MEFHYHFDASPDEQALIQKKTYQGIPSLFVLDFDCHVQKYKTHQEANMVKDMLEIDLMPYAPNPITSFEINGEGYLALSVVGAPFTPRKDDLFESKDTIYDGKLKSLFITHEYKQILRHLITYVCLQKDLLIRACIRLDTTYVWHAESNYHATSFTKYDLQDCVKNDNSDVIEEVIHLIKEINTKCCIEDACEAEFNVFFDGITMPDTPYEINEILNSVILWTKAERIEFLRKILKLAKAKEIDICGESIRASLGTDCGSKLKQMEKLVNASKRPHVEINPEEFVVDVIERIVYAYDLVAKVAQESQEGRSVMLEDAGQVVEYVQHSFPTFFAVLAEQSKTLKWPVGKMVDDYLSEELLEARRWLQAGVLPQYYGRVLRDEVATPCVDALESMEIEGYRCGDFPAVHVVS